MQMILSQQKEALAFEKQTRLEDLYNQWYALPDNPKHHRPFLENLDFIKFLIIEKNFNINQRHPKSYSPTLLEATCLNGFEKVVLFLLENGATPHTFCESGDYMGYTPLHLAALNRRIKIAKALIDKGAKHCVRGINISEYRITPLEVAAQNYNFKMVLYLFHVANAGIRKDHKNNHHILLCAAMLGDVVLTKEVLEMGVDKLHATASTTYKGKQHKWTSLYFAIKSNSLETVQALLTHGADSISPDNHGLTPQGLATELGRTKISTLLDTHNKNLPKTFGQKATDLFKDLFSKD